MIRVVIHGISGTMGSYLYQVLKKNTSIDIVACISRKTDLNLGVKVYHDLSDCLSQEDFNTLIDFSIYPHCLEVVKMAISHQKNVVSGTTGYKEHDSLMIGQLAKTNQVGVIISPNFSLIDQRFESFLCSCKEQYPYVYITESHGIHKLDKPSGTALYLTKLLNIRLEQVHSIRIPGIIASHTILFSDDNQRLEFTHTINNRDAFIPGIEQAIYEVTKTQHINLMI